MTDQFHYAIVLAPAVERARKHLTSGDEPARGLERRDPRAAADSLGGRVLPGHDGSQLITEGHDIDLDPGAFSNGREYVFIGRELIDPADGRLKWHWHGFDPHGHDAFRVRIQADAGNTTVIDGSITLKVSSIGERYDTDYCIRFRYHPIRHVRGEIQNRVLIDRDIRDLRTQVFEQPFTWPTDVDEFAITIGPFGPEFVGSHRLEVLERNQPVQVDSTGITSIEVLSPRGTMSIHIVDADELLEPGEKTVNIQWTGDPLRADDLSCTIVAINEDGNEHGTLAQIDQGAMGLYGNELILNPGEALLIPSDAMQTAVNDGWDGRRLRVTVTEEVERGRSASQDCRDLQLRLSLDAINVERLAGDGQIVQLTFTTERLIGINPDHLLVSLEDNDGDVYSLVLQDPRPEIETRQAWTFRTRNILPLLMNALLRLEEDGYSLVQQPVDIPPVQVQVSAPSITEGQDATITITLPTRAHEALSGSKTTVEIDGKQGESDIDDSDDVIVTVSGLTEGTHDISVTVASQPVDITGDETITVESGALVLKVSVPDEDIVVGGAARTITVEASRGSKADGERLSWQLEGTSLMGDIDWPDGATTGTILIRATEDEQVGEHTLQIINSSGEISIDGGNPTITVKPRPAGGELTLTFADGQGARIEGTTLSIVCGATIPDGVEDPTSAEQIQATIMWDDEVREITTNRIDATHGTCYFTFDTDGIEGLSHELVSRMQLQVTYHPAVGDALVSRPIRIPLIEDEDGQAFTITEFTCLDPPGRVDGQIEVELKFNGTFPEGWRFSIDFEGCRYNYPLTHYPQSEGTGTRVYVVTLDMGRYNEWQNVDLAVARQQTQGNLRFQRREIQNWKTIRAIDVPWDWGDDTGGEGGDGQTGGGDSGSGGAGSGGDGGGSGEDAHYSTKYSISYSDFNYTENSRGTPAFAFSAEPFDTEHPPTATVEVQGVDRLLRIEFMGDKWVGFYDEDTPVLAGEVLLKVTIGAEVLKPVQIRIFPRSLKFTQIEPAERNNAEATIRVKASWPGGIIYPDQLICVWKPKGQLPGIDLEPKVAVAGEGPSNDACDLSITIPDVGDEPRVTLFFFVAGKGTMYALGHLDVEIPSRQATQEPIVIEGPSQIIVGESAEFTMKPDAPAGSLAYMAAAMVNDQRQPTQPIFFESMPSPVVGSSFQMTLTKEMATWGRTNQWNGDHVEIYIYHHNELIGRTSVPIQVLDAFADDEYDTRRRIDADVDATGLDFDKETQIIREEKRLIASVQVEVAKLADGARQFQEHLDKHGTFEAAEFAGKERAALRNLIRTHEQVFRNLHQLVGFFSEMRQHIETNLDALQDSLGHYQDIANQADEAHLVLAEQRITMIEQRNDRLRQILTRIAELEGHIEHLEDTLQLTDTQMVHPKHRGNVKQVAEQACVAIEKVATFVQELEAQLEALGQELETLDQWDRQMREQLGVSGAASPDYLMERQRDRRVQAVENIRRSGGSQPNRGQGGGRRRGRR